MRQKRDPADVMGLVHAHLRAEASKLAKKPARIRQRLGLLDKLPPLTPEHRKQIAERDEELYRKFYRTPRQLRLRKAVLWHILEADIIIDAAKFGNAEDRRRAATLLGYIGSRGVEPKLEKEVVSSLMHMLHDNWDIKVSYAAVEAIRMMVERGHVDALREVVPQLKKETEEHFDPSMRAMIKELLAIPRRQQCKV